MTSFKIIINCGPCERFVGKCLASVQMQSMEHWQAYVTVDPCGDNTYENASRAADDDSRIHVSRNKTRLYSMCNLVRAIERSDAASEDVIISLDGDDWFSDQHALRQIASAYEETDCWITYGSWLSNVVGPSNRRDGLWPAYPEATSDFRGHRFLGTAVRTWKRWIWDYLADSDLRSDSGEYVRVSEDQMIMIPLLELCGTSRAKHIAAPIMVYNKTAQYPIDESIMSEGLRNGHLIDTRARYPRITTKQYKETKAREAFA